MKVRTTLSIIALTAVFALSSGLPAWADSHGGKVAQQPCAAHPMKKGAAQQPCAGHPMKEGAAQQPCAAQPMKEGSAQEPAPKQPCAAHPMKPGQPCSGRMGR